MSLEDRVLQLEQEVGALTLRVNALDGGVEPPPPPPVEDRNGIWISPEQIMRLADSGPAFENVLSYATRNWGNVNLKNNDSMHDVCTLAGAYAGVRLQDSDFLDKTRSALFSCIDSPLSRVLELVRGLQAYLVAADVIGYQYQGFYDWVEDVITNTRLTGHGGNGVIATAMYAANNWGNHARAALLMAGLYLKRSDWVQIVIDAHSEYIGETQTRNLKFKTPISTWHADVTHPRGVNPRNAMRQGIYLSGIQAEDWRRASYNFTWKPPIGDTYYYYWEVMQGLVVTAVILDRQGLVPITAGDHAVQRTFEALYGIGAEASQNVPVFELPATGDDRWLPWLANAVAGMNLTTEIGTPGKGMGFTSWTHGG